jgi:kynurenine formamidase
MPNRKYDMKPWKASAWTTVVFALLASATLPAGKSSQPALWTVYENSLKSAKYVDLTHAITPSVPVWPGFGASTFSRTVDPATNVPYTYEKDGFEATHYDLSTDQLGTQLDPPAHWNPYYPAIDELPPTYTLRPLVVVPIQDKVAADPGYQMTVADIEAWERRHGKIPEGAVVFIRSDWSKAWPDPQLAARTRFPGVALSALQFLHLQRRILFHGHEPLDTDTTPTLEGEAWLLRNGYTQAARRGESGQSSRGRRARLDRFSEIPGGHRRLRSLYRDLSARLEIWRERWRRCRGAAAAQRAASALGQGVRHAHSITIDARSAEHDRSVPEDQHAPL